MANNVPIIEIADDPVPAPNPMPEPDEESSISGDSEQDTREMYAALDSLNMLPISNATPLSAVFPKATEASQIQHQTETNLTATAEILLHMNQGNPAEQQIANEGDKSPNDEVLLLLEDLIVENPLSAMVLYSHVVSLCRPFHYPSLIFQGL